MEPTHRYRIVIALDASEYAELVLEHGLDQASRHDPPDLHVLAVIDDRTDPETTKTWLARIVLEGLDSFRAGRPYWRTRLHVRRGRPEEEIVDLAAEVDADLIVVGRHGLHLRRGSVADRVVATAHCPTLVVAGVPGRAVDPEQACAACATVREESDGERWFCSEHTAPDRLRLSALLPSSSSLVHGGPLW